MDKKSVIGFVVIGIILLVWLTWTSNMQKKQVTNNKDTVKVNVIDSLDKAKQTKDSVKITIKETSADSLKADTLLNKYGKMFYGRNVYSNGTPEKIIMLETKKAYMEFTNYGGTIRKYVMRDYKTYNGDTLQLIDWKKGKELNLLFTSKDGKAINTKDLVFNSTYKDWERVNLENLKDFKLRYALTLPDDSTSKIIKTYTFHPDSYEFDVDYELINSKQFISGGQYQVVWGSSLNLSEYLSTDEATFSEAYAYMGGELSTFTAKKFINEYKESEDKENLNGATDFVSTRNKYFGIFIIPKGRTGDGAYLTGYKEHLPNEGLKNDYSIAVKMDIKNENIDKTSFQILITPIDYNLLKSYDKNLEKTMRFSLDFIVRPIAQYFIIPFFTFLHKFIPNYGVVIIIFAFVLKLLLNPLTKTQMKSMKKMGQLNPKMTAIREKYKDDPAKMNKMIMNLYKEEKINPAGGCLPMLLQLPILYALFGVFRSTIELRQAHFFWWINDLSAPDVIFRLPMKIPIFGIDMISGLATLMGITMFIQQKMTVTDPKQKAMVYIMPVMLTLLFFSFPSGLNLYYFIFNLLSIIQQYYNTKIKKDDPIKLKEEKNKPTFMQRLQKRGEEIRKANSKRRR
jgi:YidC/Oxa1 family membrane protein insertase